MLQQSFGLLEANRKVEELQRQLLTKELLASQLQEALAVNQGHKLFGQGLA